MRTHWLLPAVLAVIVVASGLALVAAPARAAPAVTAAPQTTATHPLATTDWVMATNQYGANRSNFYVGYSSGVIYFTSYDPSDTQGTITVLDQNATRDHLTNPVFTYTPSFSASAYNDSWANGVGYLIPLDLTYGGNWTVSLSGTNGGIYNVTVFVHTYSAYIYTTQNAYLPGHSGQANFGVERTANFQPYPYATVKVVAQVYTTGGTWNNLQGSPFTFTDVARGSFNFTVPLTASTTGELAFYLYANATIGLSETAFNSVDVGNLSQPVVHVGTCPGGCYTNSFTNGTPVYVQVSMSIVGLFASAPANGTKVTPSFSSGGVPVTPANVPSFLITNASGGAWFVFIASAPTFSLTQTNEITITASDPLNPSLAATNTHVFFGVSKLGSFTPTIEVQFASLQYFGGDTATVNWQLGGINSSATAGWTVDQWKIQDGSGSGATLGVGTINSTQAQGQFTFPIPVNYGGRMYAYVSAYNASDWTENFGSTLVTAPTILLNPSEPYFLPGDTVTVSVTTQGSVFSGTTLYQSVVESSGYQISTGVLSGNQISFAIPKTGSPSSVTVSVAAQSATLGVVAAASVTVDEGSGYVLYAGIDTASNYADGSFQPGQTIQISYNLVAIGTAILPKTFEVGILPGSAMYFGSGYGAVYSQVTSSSGSISYTIPSGVKAGAQTFSVVVSSAICGFSCGAGTQFSALIQPNPSALNYELGAGSGVTVGWVVLLVLILLVGLGAVWMVRRGRSGGKTAGVKPFTPASSPPPSSGAGSSSWKEGDASSGGSSPPPMPEGPKSS